MRKALFVAAIAMIGAPGVSLAKSDHANHGRGRAAPIADAPVGFGAGGCPPGLKNKNAACMPPGRSKKLFEIGQRVPNGYKGLIAYNALPYDLRMGYGGALDPDARYIYDQHYLYRVDPGTMIVRQILRSLP